MKKLALECEKIIEMHLKNDDVCQLESNITSLINLKKSLTIFSANISSAKGFPFNLPDVEWLSKAYLYRSILKTAIQSLENVEKFNDLFLNLNCLSYSLDNMFTTEIINLIRTIKTLNNKFLCIRQILSEHEKNSKQIKNQMKNYLKQIKKHSIKYPKMKLIIKRVKKYWNNLFHAYDDERIPFTNLEIERVFNVLKRKLRKRTGLKTRKNYLIEEGEQLLIIEQVLPINEILISEKLFIEYFISKRNIISSNNLSRRNKEAKEKRKELKNHSKRKYSLKKVLKMFSEFRTGFHFC